MCCICVGLFFGSFFLSISNVFCVEGFCNILVFGTGDDCSAIWEDIDYVGVYGECEDGWVCFDGTNGLEFLGEFC